jgi:hypothetical protein
VIGRAIQYHFGKSDRGFGTVADIGMVIGELSGLRRDRFGNFLATITDIHTVKSGNRIEQTIAVAVFNMAILAACDHALRYVSTGELSQMGRWVEKVFAVPFFKMIVFKHSIIL